MQRDGARSPTRSERYNGIRTSRLGNEYLGRRSKGEPRDALNYTDYQVPRMSDVPNIGVRVVSTDNPPTGAGEDGQPLVAGAIGNAIAALTGVRLRELPFSPERVKHALNA
jgi:CO/xanthine dehydrogenase Mo-binding subunit